MGKTTYNPIVRYMFQNGVFEGGLVENPTHHPNTVYLRLDIDDDVEYIHEITIEEALIIINCLTRAVLSCLCGSNIQNQVAEDEEESNS